MTTLNCEAEATHVVGTAVEIMTKTKAKRVPVDGNGAPPTRSHLVTASSFYMLQEETKVRTCLFGRISLMRDVSACCLQPTDDGSLPEAFRRRRYDVDGRPRSLPLNVLLLPKKKREAATDETTATQHIASQSSDTKVPKTDRGAGSKGLTIVIDVPLSMVSHASCRRNSQ